MTSDLNRLRQMYKVFVISRLTDEQIENALKPSTLEIYNDSHKHAHHKAMQGVTSREVCCSYISPCSDYD